MAKLFESMNQSMNPSECSLSCVTPLITIHVLYWENTVVTLCMYLHTI